MFNPTRNQARQLFFDTWHKYQQREPLSGMETIAVEVILQHPEYHSILQDTERYLDKDYPPEQGKINPFLHMSMHIAIREQLTINQPTGILQRFEQLKIKLQGDEHEAMHHTMDCLAEMLWQSQRNQSSPDASIYLECMDKQIGNK
ncbi:MULTISPECIES: DUF1841 family protein [Nitrosomonas]|uniref:Uncharacterized protein DUF1841 n=2 Tax=Nitrosomonas eutropha TaxID=916 RepID=A0ABX5M901_9PROT|nr:MULTISPECIES: DUF1841 family protein [Nitrosomonas]ABI59892.1 conserved hypothetical protein [Nitrosomonas eutropha C91]MXS80391.1 DUF1841 family protein [Nitrosomonas sp. GH22]PXV80105.1 uncharacterized protein DUF1841 [Nitrosomonas eutropha]SCX21263.1 protein of unknown function [Nitrosomonas eutropha]SDW77271.1 protein of unknown function [Nitrosomonas eutropha]